MPRSYYVFGIRIRHDFHTRSQGYKTYFYAFYTLGGIGLGVSYW